MVKRTKLNSKKGVMWDTLLFNQFVKKTWNRQGESFFLGKSICWKLQVLAALPADHNKADSSGHQTVVLFVRAKCWYMAHSAVFWHTVQILWFSFGTLCKNLSFLCWQYVGIWKSAHCAFTPFVDSCCLSVYSLVGFKCQYIPCLNTSHSYPNVSEKQWEDKDQTD